ncbi:MAG: AAA family ATPase [Spirulina sp.]
MINISNYQTREIIYESENSLVYRARNLTDNQSVILKILKQVYPSPERIAQFQQEYEITNALNLSGVVNVDRILETDDHRWVIVVEDFGGQSLDNIAPNSPLTLDEFLGLAIKVTQILGEVHQRRVIHKDINSSNIVWNRKTNEIKLIDFGISTKLSRETTSFRNPNLLEGTLAYISPEQTGRMNRDIDYRSDFYSLGIMFYELLVGQRPFESTDPMELVHSHIAKQPIPPHKKKSEIPQVISNIIMKLMAKTAEERYQSAWGLKADLETCQQELQTCGEISEFALGNRDISDRFQISQKLYGRQEEVEQLLAGFERVSRGAVEMILVAGYSGIGKSALVNEIHKPITKQKGYFIAGKFDQFKRDIPYAALIQAFQELMRQLLTESETQLQLWQQKLLDALGNNGQVIVDVIPEVELIIGEQPPIPQLGPTESQNRFNWVFQNFLGVFTQKEHPLVIFIDDLQWADLESLQLLELLMSDRDRQYLALIGAYRDNEIGPAHPLLQILEQIQEQETRVDTIVLKPLEINWVNQLIADTLKCSPEESQPLAELAFEKTHGNPFFLTQLLQSLYTENLLSFNSHLVRWRWNIEQIQAVRITDNVVDLMVNKIEKLENRTENVLKLAACIGNPFDLAILSVVNGKSMSLTAMDLWPALEQGLILPPSDTYKLLILKNEEIFVQSSEKPVSIPYKFLHDRVQQAAYALIPEAQKQKVHLQIGQLLLKNTASDQLEENIFDLVNQLNIGADLISTVSERNELARLNLMAGKKAKASTAYQAALKYFNTGLELLTSESWEDEYDLTLTLYLETVGAEYLNAQFAEAEKLAAVVLKRARSAIDKVGVYEIKIQSYRSQVQYQRAIETALEILAQLGVVLPPQPSQEDIAREQQGIDVFLQDKQIEDLALLPKMTNPYKLATVRILGSILTTTVTSNPPLCTLVTLSIINFSIEYGNSNLSPLGYGFYSAQLVIADEIQAAYRFAQLSIGLVETLNSRQLKYLSLHTFCSFVQAWRDPLKATYSNLLEAVDAGIENGDLEYSCLAAADYCNHIFCAGENLLKLERECIKYLKFTVKYKQYLLIDYFKSLIQIVSILLDRSENKEEFEAEIFDEKAILSVYLNTNQYGAIYFLYWQKSMLLYLFKKFTGALENSQLCPQYEASVSGMICIGVRNFYDSLSHLAVYPKIGPDEQKQYLKQVAANQKRMKFWAENAPANFQHKYDLVVAETARVLGKNARAREYYDRAIEGAKKYGYLQEEAIAYERGAEFYFAIGREEIGQLYMKNAHYTYQRWGADAKVKDLEAEYPELFRSSPSRTIASLSNNNISTSTTELLDLATVLKLTNALSSEIVLDKLLATLMNILVENAGAERGILILPRGEDLWVEATQETDSENVSILQSLPIEEFTRLSTQIVLYVARMHETIVLNDAINDGNSLGEHSLASYADAGSHRFLNDPYIQQYRCQSIACMPLIHRGMLEGIVYLENNLTTGAFTQERMALLRTLSTQAAISLENARLYETLEQRVEERTAELSQTVTVLKNTQAELKLENELLKSDEQAENFDYQIGGSLTLDSPTYVVRSADRHLYQALRAGKFCYTFNARQMGKSSLMVRILKQLREDGDRCIAIDLTGIGGENITPDQWYKGIAVEMWRQFGLLRKFKLKPWWNERKDIPPPQRLKQFIEEVVLAEIKKEERDEPAKIIIFFDEIDCILSLKFPVNDFFALLRACYNQRAIDPNYRRLTFALFGVTTPSTLISDPQKTPFNIGYPIHLEGFKVNEAQPLLYGLANKVNNPQTILKEIIGWTGGQPFLTQKVCQLIRDAQSEIPLNGEVKWVEDLVRENILENWEAQDDPEHLKTVRDRILRSDRRNPLLSLYLQILRPEETPATYSELEQELLLSGLAIAREGKLKVNNRIYHSIFDRQWVENHFSEQ